MAGWLRGQRGYGRSSRGTEARSSFHHSLPRGTRSRWGLIVNKYGERRSRHSPWRTPQRGQGVVPRIGNQKSHPRVGRLPLRGIARLLDPLGVRLGDGARAVDQADTAAVRRVAHGAGDTTDELAPLAAPPVSLRAGRAAQALRPSHGAARSRRGCASGWRPAPRRARSWPPTPPPRWWRTRT